ncbi:uncharacterized protein AMSG_07963 [Thecamonas trahens ATCC 50062]|uniref:Leucine-rich repeat and WD repeat-containing protein 1 WD domain-containing protein n=1 Tax=Thecamonas trahens ATCC 50062 TaxID=461836 RepID=A0A0L0DKH3_THETB|nr:hypothetical protein AMSG_07963 [Thecamonas trahens ATCC 50062]KNC51868.1 hypothetical protein AMSG_07963 [Thecamonas trahens ATCC 50062]|eukprot:XP_013755728.1 hypothetical protein AMSG_07963 [Thecamonas trahens ATCC 50062]
MPQRGRTSPRSPPLSPEAGPRPALRPLGARGLPPPPSSRERQSQVGLRKPLRMETPKQVHIPGADEVRKAVEIKARKASETTSVRKSKRVRVLELPAPATNPKDASRDEIETLEMAREVDDARAFRADLNEWLRGIETELAVSQFRPLARRGALTASGPHEPAHLARHLQVSLAELPTLDASTMTSEFVLRTVIRAHAGVNSSGAVPSDAEAGVVVRQVGFKPSLDPELKESSIVASVGGETVIIVDCASRNVVKKCRPAADAPPGMPRESLAALAWTVLPAADERIVLAVGGTLGVIYLLAPDLNVLYEAIRLGIDHGITALAFHPVKSAWLFSASASGVVLLHDVGCPGPSAEAYPPTTLASFSCAGRGGLHSLALSPMHDMLFGAGANGKLHCWPLGEELDQVRNPRPRWLEHSTRTRLSSKTATVHGFHARVHGGPLAFALPLSAHSIAVASAACPLVDVLVAGFASVGEPGGLGSDAESEGSDGDESRSSEPVPECSDVVSLEMRALLEVPEFGQGLGALSPAGAI